MTTYRYMSDTSLDGYRGVYLVHESETPLGSTRQAEIVYVNGWNENDVREKAKRLLKGSVAECIDGIMEAPKVSDVWETRSVSVDGDTYQIPKKVYDEIRNQLIAEQTAAE